MAALLLALVLALLLEQGSASQLRIAGAGRGRDAWIMIAAASLTTALAGIGGGALAEVLSGEARLLFLALALGFAATGLLFSVIAPSAARPSASAGPARFVAFLASRAGENILFTVAAVSAFTGAPALTALGGAAGSLAALFAATLTAPGTARSPAHRAARALMGMLLLVGSMFAAADALHLIG